jgi:hypothetical protein
MTIMDQKTKISKLGSIDEKTLRESVLVPLLNRIGFQTVTVYHGPTERGKDIICFDYDRLGSREYLAVVAKATDLDGSVSSSDSLREVLYQIEQCFDVPYEDLFGMTRITMDRVWVVTSRRIIPGAAGSVADHLKKGNLSKLVRFISGEQLAQLIDRHYPAYWDESLEPAEVVKEQKERLTSFCRRLLLSLGANPVDVESAITQLIHGASPPGIISVPDKMLTRLTSYQVEIDSIAAPYSHDFYSTQCGLIRDAYLKAKKDIFYAMFRVDEIMGDYEEVIGQTDPHELVDAFQHGLGQQYPFWKASWGEASDAVNDVEALKTGLEDVDLLRKRLSSIGKLEWAISLVDSARGLEDKIVAYLDAVDKESFLLYWRIDTRDGLGRLVLDYERNQEDSDTYFFTEHTREVERYNSRQRQKTTSAITVQEIMDEVQYKIRQHLEKLLTSAGVPEDE